MILGNTCLTSPLALALEIMSLGLLRHPAVGSRRQTGEHQFAIPSKHAIQDPRQSVLWKI